MLGYKKRKNNHTATYMLAALTVFAVWISSMNTNHQLLITSNIISVAYAQRESIPSEVSTPFLEWYEKQKYNLQRTNSLSVKIMSPVKGEQVPSGQEIIVSGISTDNATSDCKVSVIVNNVKPYQPAIANGTGGTNDYSTWNFMITPTYTTIKEGPNNKITSKLECTPNLTKWYGVNVTGVNTTTNTNRAETTMQTPFVLFPLPIMPDNNNNITDSISTLSSTNTSNSFSTGSVGYPSKSLLSISLNVTSNSVALGDDQTIEAKVLDAVSHLQIDNAILDLEITDSAGNTIEEFSDNDGSISYTFEVGAAGAEGEEDGETVIPDTFMVTLRASAVGYEPESKTTTFNLVEQDEDVEDNNNNNNIIDDEEDLESIGDSSNSNELFG